MSQARPTQLKTTTNILKPDARNLYRAKELPSGVQGGMKRGVEDISKGFVLPRDGLIVSINKPPGITSFDAVSRIRRATGVRRVGHAGTLDPFAEGVLVVGIGRAATRRLGEFVQQEKEYLAQVVLGVVTDTYDPTGQVLEQNPFEHPGEERIGEVMGRFVGWIEQIPPPFSAVKVGGMKLYKAARRGIRLEGKPRKVNIKLCELTGLTPDGFEMRVVCSRGTYIRSMAYDIGRELGCGAHLGRLVRTRIGGFTLDQAERLDVFVSRLQAVRGVD